MCNLAGAVTETLEYSTIKVVCVVTRKEPEVYINRLAAANHAG